MLVRDPGQPVGSRSSLGKWLVWGVVCVLIIGLIGFFGLYHLVFRIPLVELWKPYALISLLTLPTFAAMYWANKSAFKRLKRRAAVVSVYTCLVSMVGIYYAALAGIMPREEVVGFSIFMTTGLVVSFVLAYFLRKKLDQRGAPQQQRGGEDASGPKRRINR
jgi:hypothetical protein